MMIQKLTAQLLRQFRKISPNFKLSLIFSTSLINKSYDLVVSTHLLMKGLKAWRPQQQAMTSCKRRLFVEADCENSLLLQNC